MSVQSGGRSEDGLALRSREALRDEERVTGAGRVVGKLGAVMRPVELGDAFEVWPRLSAECWRRPDADVAAADAALSASPKGYKRVVGGESQGADRRIDELGRGAVGQIVKLSGTDLRQPNIHLSVAVGQEGDKIAVAGDGSVLLDSVEVGDCLKSSVGDWASPEVFGSLQPQDRTYSQ